jgi:hypothetical protein
MPGGKHYNTKRPKAMQKRWRRDWLESPEACAENHNSLGMNNIDPNVYVYTADALSMAKLYWRYKKEGKWTWKAAMVIVNNAVSVTAYSLPRQEEE